MNDLVGNEVGEKAGKAVSKKKYEITGFVYNRIEKIGGEEMQHLGFEPDKGDFGDLLIKFVPNVGDKKKVKITFEILEDEKE